MNPSTVYCDNCGTTNRPTASFCTKCGQAMAAAPSAFSTQEARPSFPTGTTLYIWSRHSFSVKAVAWSPDGRHIASASDEDKVQIWDPSNGSHVYTYLGHKSFWTTLGVKAVAWSPDSQRIASGSGDKTVQVWVAE